MLYRNASIFAFACVMAVAGCRDNGTLTPADLSMGGGGGGGGGGGTGDMAVVMKNYMPSTIAAMRQMPAGQNDFELDNVVAIALTPSTKSPKLYVQDAAGGDFSAIEADCSTSSTSHMCNVASTVHTTVVGDKVTLKGTFVKAGMTKGGYETFYIDSIMDNGAGTPPAPLAVTETAIEKAVDATATGWNKDFFQKVTVTPSETIVMYDWTPTELKYSGSGAWPGCTTLPFVFGFSMIPMSVASTPANAACTVKTAAAPTQTANDKEILIGTDFYKDFQVSSDCQCAKTPTTVPAQTTTWASGKPITGVLIYTVPFGASAGYRQFSPTQTPDSTTMTALTTPPM